MGLSVITPDNRTLYYSTTYNSVQITKHVISTSNEFNDPENYKMLTGVIENWGYLISATFNIWDNEADYVEKNGPNIINTTAVQFTSNTIPENLYESVYTSLKQTLHGTITDDI